MHNMLSKELTPGDKKNASIVKKSLVLIFITLLIDCIGFGIIIPVMPKLLLEIGNYDNSQASKIAGYLIFAFALTQFFMSPIIGNLSDKYGRRPILLLSLLGFGLDYIFLAVANTIPLFFVGRVIAGICGASFSTASAYIADISTNENRTKNFGMIGIAFGLGFIIGPIIGGLAGSFGTRIPFYVAAFFSVLNATLCYFMLPESLKKENRRNFSLKRANPFGALMAFKKVPMIMALLIPMILLYLASHAVQSNWAFYTKYKFNWDEKMIGISLAVVGVCIAFVQGGLVSFTMKYLGEKKSILIGFAFYFIGMLLFALASQGYMIFIFTAVYCLGGICGPPLNGLMAGATPANQQGELSGLLTSIMSITSIFGPLIMNGLFAFYTAKDQVFKLPEAPMLLGSFLILIATLLIWPMFKRALRKELK